MAIGIKYLAGSSVGTPYETGESRSVLVTAETLSAVSGYEGDTVTYTATVLDSEAEKVPAAFMATLKINGTDLVVDQAFDAGVYNQSTGELNLDFTVPAAVAELTVTLNWAEQII